MISNSSKQATDCEETLIASARQGDDEAFATLAKNYKRVLELQVNLIDCPPSIREDLLQEGLIGLFKAVKTYDGSTAAFTTYATHCIRNSIISGIRKYSAQSKFPLAGENAEEETAPSAEEILLDSVRVRSLYDKVISALSPYERLVFDMYLSDMTYENIAFVTGKDVKSAANAVYRIRTKLKQIISR